MTPLTIATFCLSLLAAGSMPQEPAPAEKAKARVVTRWAAGQAPQVFQWNGEVVEGQEPAATCPHCNHELPKPKVAKVAKGFAIERSKAQEGESAPRMFRVVEGQKLAPAQRKAIALKSLEGLKGLEGLKQLEGLKELKELKGFALAQPERFRGHVVEVEQDGAKPKRIERRMDEHGNVEVIEIAPGEHRVEVRKRALPGQAMPSPKKLREMRMVVPPASGDGESKRVHVHRIPGAEAGGTTVIIIGGGAHAAPKVQVQHHEGHAEPHRIEISQLDTPAIEVEGFEMPAIEVEGFEMPELEIPAFEVEGFEIPAFEVEGFEMPAFEIEGFEMPAIDLSGFEFPALRFGDFRFPSAKAGSCEGPCGEESIEVRDTEVAPRPAAPATTRDLIHL
jgi:hypothetical protein